MRKIPRTMCTQHPDYANVPDWVTGGFIKGDDEVYEAYLNYSVYECQETMWDFEGKDVDIYVIRKLLENYGGFFMSHVIGEDIFLTYRLPNPYAEVSDRKMFAEALETIPIAYDLAKLFYGKPVRAIFEVIFPLASDARQLIATFRYYERAIANRGSIKLMDDLTVLDMLGDVEPKSIEVIPLIEDMDSMLNVESIVGGYVRAIRPSYMRVFIARSDPAMNYGLISAVLLAKIALSRLSRLSRSLNIPIFPIIGVGPTPFRGHFNPTNVERVLDEYPGIYTFTVQSAFRYDYPVDDVKAAVRFVNESRPSEAVEMDPGEEGVIVEFLKGYMARYQAEVEGLANAINTVAQLLPPRRTRRLHIGLFGYGRGFRGVTLPRAISFVGALYSMGIPPEVLGLSAIVNAPDSHWDLLRRYYRNLLYDLSEAAGYICLDCIRELTDMKLGVSKEIVSMILEDIKALDELGIKYPGGDFRHRKHALLTRLFLDSLRSGYINDAKEYLVEMAKTRRAIG